MIQDGVQTSLFDNSIVYQHPAVNGCLMDSAEQIMDEEKMSNWCKLDTLKLYFGINNRCAIHIKDHCVKKKMCENF